ncbi:MAG: MBL fold metallo-hydrolase [Opitutaceae bacterium]
MDVNLTILVEDSAHRRGLFAEHGLAIGLEFAGRRVLFDAGQSGEVLVRNARALGWDLAAVESIVVSHGHFDHTGGLAAALFAAPSASLHYHPAALAPKFQRDEENRVNEFGITDESLTAVQHHHGPRRETIGVTEIVPGLFATGVIPRITDFETTGGAFFLDPAGSVVDPLIDDQALFFRSTEGVVVILGCAHAGVLNTLDYARSFFPGAPLAAVVGGMHLWKADRAYLARVAAGFGEHAPHFVAGCHCTGHLRGVLPDHLRHTQIATGAALHWHLALAP